MKLSLIHILHSPKRIIVCEKDENRLQFIRQHYPHVLTVQPEDCAAFVRAHSDHGGADVVLEVAGADTTFRDVYKRQRLTFLAQELEKITADLPVWG